MTAARYAVLAVDTVTARVLGQLPILAAEAKQALNLPGDLTATTPNQTGWATNELTPWATSRPTMEASAHPPT